jgi:hypothetical protein
MKKNTLSLLGLLILSPFLWAQTPPETQTAILEMKNITEAGDYPVTLQVWYQSPSGINRASGDDLDLWVSSQAGFHATTHFGQWLPIRRAGSTATYELAPPPGGWTRDHNGEYAVMLASEEIDNNDGSSFPLTLTGSFRVDIVEERPTIPALSGEVVVHSLPTPGAPNGEYQALAIADFSVTFPYPVDVQWSELTLDPSGEFLLSVEGYDSGGIVPQVLTTYSHQVEIGVLSSGDYSISLLNEKAILSANRFTIGSSEPLIPGLPSKVDIQIQELPSFGILPTYVAEIQMTFDEFVAESQWGDLQQDGSTLSSEFTAWIDPSVRMFAPMVIESQVFLGMLEPGEFLYQITSLEKTIAEKTFLSGGVIGGGDFSPPLVTVNEALLSEPSDGPLEFSVAFSDPSGLEVGGIEAQVLTAVNWLGETFQVEKLFTITTSDFPTSNAITSFQMAPPGGSWGSEDHGRYRLFLSEPELVCDLKGNHLTNPHIGYLTVDLPGDPEPLNPAEITLVHQELIGRWTAQVRLFVPENLAVRDDWAVNWGSVQARGLSLFLEPRFVEAGSGNPLGVVDPSDTTGAGMWVEHAYDLGPIAFGPWLICLESNLGHFAKEFLDVEIPSIEDDTQPFDLWLNGYAPEGPPELSLWEYVAGTDPNNQFDNYLFEPSPVILSGEDDLPHLGLQCRIATTVMDARLRFQGSSDMVTWVDLGPDQIEEVERQDLGGGLQKVVFCLIEPLNQGEIRYLRAIAERW